MNRNSARLDFIGLSIFFFVLYALTAPHTVTLEDSGEFLMTGYYWGVAHPPGYPLYTLLGKVASFFPFGSVAYRIHLLSAAFGAVAAGFLYLSALKLLKQRFVALAAALAYGLSLTFWSQAIIAEVYALNALFFLALLYLALETADQPTARKVFGFSFLFGLSLTNHWPLILLNFPVFTALLWSVRREFTSRLAKVAGLFVLGLVPYLLMIWRSHAAGEMVFSGPIQSFGELFDYVIRKDYMSIEASATASLKDSALFFRDFLLQAATEFTYAGVALILAGAVYAARSLNKQTLFIFGWGILSSSLILKFFEINDYEPLNVEAYLVYHLIPYAFLALLIGAGIILIQKPLPKLPGAIWPAALGILLLAIHFPKNNMSSDDFAFRYAGTVLKHLPERAKLFVSAETDAGPIGYAHYVENVRPDVAVYSQMGLLFKNAILDHTKDTVETKIRKSKAFFKANEPVYLSTPLFFITGDSIQGLTQHRRGLFSVLSSQPVPENSEALIADAKAFLDEQLVHPYRGVWRYHAGSIFSYYCLALARANVEHEFSRRNPFCSLQYAAEKFNRQDFAGADPILEGLVDGPQFLNHFEHAQMVNLFGQNRVNLINSKNPAPAERRIGYEQVAGYLRRALDNYPACDNAVWKTLLALDRQAGIPAQDLLMQKRFANCQNL
jgi:hypothetical protein